jgi:cell division protein FtsL
MGEAARKLSHEAPAAPRGTHLRVVKTRTRDRVRMATPSARADAAHKPRAPKRPSARQNATGARAVFAVFVWVALGIAAVAMVRVGVMARVAEMSLTEGSLRSSIKSERVVAGQLEVDKSALMAPSRVESIASATMQMTKPVSVNYLLLPAGFTRTAGAPAGTSVRTDKSGLGDVIGAVLDMSAGEAQSLLVGDVGLAGSR